MTQPLNAAELESLVARAVVTDLDTGETTELTSKLNKHCLFFEHFGAGGYVVQLRLDWADMDDNGHPMLDADFLDPVTKKPDHSLRSDPAHHTGSADSDERTYEWRFRDAAKRFTVAVTWSASGVSSASATASGTPTIVRPPYGETEGRG